MIAFPWYSECCDVGCESDLPYHYFRTLINAEGSLSKSPVQLSPFPVYPGWHSHTCDPMVFVQLAFTWQELFPLHSSISEKPKTKEKRASTITVFQIIFHACRDYLKR